LLGSLIKADVQLAGEQIAVADFFGTIFQEEHHEQESLQSKVIAALREEVFSWHDEAS